MLDILNGVHPLSRARRAKRKGRKQRLVSNIHRLQAPIIINKPVPRRAEDWQRREPAAEEQMITSSRRTKENTLIVVASPRQLPSVCIKVITAAAAYTGATQHNRSRLIIPSNEGCARHTLNESPDLHANGPPPCPAPAHAKVQCLAGLVITIEGERNQDKHDQEHPVTETSCAGPPVVVTQAGNA